MLAGTTTEQKARLVEGFEKARKGIAVVRLEVKPEGAAVLLDGSSAGTAPLTEAVFVEPGERRVRVEKPGYEAYVGSFAVQKGETKTVRIVLEASAASAAPAPHGGIAAGKGSTGKPSSNAGGDPGWKSGFHPRTIAIITGAGLTAVALGVGVGFKLEGSSANSDADDFLTRAKSQYGSSPCSGPPGSSSDLCVQLANKRDERNDANLISNVSFYAAGALAAGTLGMFLLWPSEPERAGRLKASPWVSPSARGLMFGGNF